MAIAIKATKNQKAAGCGALRRNLLLFGLSLG